MGVEGRAELDFHGKMGRRRGAGGYVQAVSVYRISATSPEKNPRDARPIAVVLLLALSVGVSLAVGPVTSSMCRAVGSNSYAWCLMYLPGGFIVATVIQTIVGYLVYEFTRAGAERVFRISASQMLTLFVAVNAVLTFVSIAMVVTGNDFAGEC